MARALLVPRKTMRLPLLAFVVLIGTTSRSARADAEIADPDVSVVLDEDAALDAVDNPPADVGALLPNGEPMPPPDLAADAGGCSCRTTGAAATLPAALLLLLAALTRRQQPRA